jgi:hypothetical protein
VPFRHELRNQLRRILAVGVEDDRGAGVDLVEAGGERGLFAEVAAEPQQRDSGSAVAISSSTAQVRSRLPSSMYRTWPSMPSPASSSRTAAIRGCSTGRDSASLKAATTMVRRLVDI